MARYPLTPAEFDAKCRELWRRCPWLSETSGRRSEARNERVGGSVESKHLVGMGRDYAAPDDEGLRQAFLTAMGIGLWALNEGDHLHVQGLPPGPIPEWWREKYQRG